MQISWNEFTLRQSMSRVNQIFDTLFEIVRCKFCNEWNRTHQSLSSLHLTSMLNRRAKFIEENKRYIIQNGRSIYTNKETIPLTSSAASGGHWKLAPQRVRKRHKRIWICILSALEFFFALSCITANMETVPSKSVRAIFH